MRIKGASCLLPLPRGGLRNTLNQKAQCIHEDVIIQSRDNLPLPCPEEKSGALVAQWEHTVIVVVEKDGCTVITE